MHYGDGAKKIRKQEEYTPCGDLAFKVQNKIHGDVFLVWRIF